MKDLKVKQEQLGTFPDDSLDFDDSHVDRCRNCRLLQVQHVETHCLFEPTFFFPMTQEDWVDWMSGGNPEIIVSSTPLTAEIITAVYNKITKRGVR